MKIGVLAIQGGVAEHIHHLEAIGSEAVYVKGKEDLEGIDGLILPGGESTAIGKILKDTGVLALISDRVSNGLPVWGTCAGMIMLAKEIENETDIHLGTMDIRVKRNAYGSQLDSFKTMGIIKEVSEKEIPLVFIRAPYISAVGEGVKVLYRLDENIVAVTEKNMLATSFHPELTDNLEFHRYFIKMCESKNIYKNL